MKRSELEHIIRASGSIAGDDDIVVIGSQAVLGQFPDSPASLLVSMEADVYPRSDPARSDLIDGAIGEGSAFHDQFGYYAQGVDETTATLPRGWQKRLVPIKNENTRGVTGWCLEVHDLAISKYVAGRPKDLAFTRELARQRMTSGEVLAERLRSTRLPAEVRRVVTARIRADFPGQTRR
ncbi:MAG: DUF6036 family nucleotidyltransferase [Steroidobacteraceae bacterium]